MMVMNKNDSKNRLASRTLERINLQASSSQGLLEKESNLSRVRSMDLRTRERLLQSRNRPMAIIGKSQNLWNDLAKLPSRRARSVLTKKVLKGEDLAVLNIQSKINDLRSSKEMKRVQ